MAKKKVIWFNHWFSALAITIEKLKEAYPSLKVIGSNGSRECAYRDACDEFIQEPAGLSEAEYVDWALAFCKEHKVNVFWPKKNRYAISVNYDKFADIGVKLIVEDPTTMAMFDSKSKAYEKLKKLGSKYVPEYYTVRSLKKFRQAYNTIRSKGYEVIAKFDSDEGASSFRVITDSILTAASLKGQILNAVSYDDYCKILADMEDKNCFKPIMVMPKLDGPEVSVDCMPMADGSLVAIPRYKLGNRIKEIKFNPDLIEDVNWIHEMWEFEAPFNVQYRWCNGKPKLLEVNTRLSGGAHLSALCGFDIAKQVVGDAFGLDAKQDPQNMRSVKVTQYETPVVLEYTDGV